MRINFDLKPLEPFTFIVEGENYSFSSLKPLAQKLRPATNISEFVYKLPTGKHVYLTVVGDENQTSEYSVHKGWYVAEILSDENAEFLIKALEKFTALYP